jgi:rifampicin phosphotransferase
MTHLVMALSEIDRRHVLLVGGKGAHLGELSRIEAIRVPDGFCVTTAAFQRAIASRQSFDDLLRRLSLVKYGDLESVRMLSAEIRAAIADIAIPDDLKSSIASAHARLGAEAACAVRSSATAEDLPTASFAGQQDTYLNVVGLAEVLQHVSRCWASLFTERAVTYRLKNGFENHKIRMAVVIQRMIPARVAGIMFTADPVNGNRKVTSVEASFGLGEALVSGLVNADAFKVKDGAIVARAIGSKRLAVVPLPGGGTRHDAIEPERQTQATLTDSQVLRLVELGRRIEGHFGAPQDIEWCLADDVFHFVQSRPITTLFPVPLANDGTNRVYVSVGHQQMMTDPMRPLGLSFWQMKTQTPMSEAGGRLFVDVTAALASPLGRAGLLSGLGKSDPLIGDALQTLVDRGDFLVPQADSRMEGSAQAHAAPPPPMDTDPSIATGLIARSQAALAALKHDIRGKSGVELLDFIHHNNQELKRFLFDPIGMQVILGGIRAAWWLNEHLEAWLGVKNAADVLTQSVPHNVTSEMGLALLDVADVIRRHPAVASYLNGVDGDDYLERLSNLPGGQEARDALQRWLDKYGMRGVGEIDITRPRFYERPFMLLPMILGHVRSFAPGEAERRFEQGRRSAALLERELLDRLQNLPDGDHKAAETKRMIFRVRSYAGYREYPKYAWVSRDAVYKQALLEEAQRLVRGGVLREREDLYFLRFEELQEVVRTNRSDERLIHERKEAFKSYRRLTPPRVLTSEGETVNGAYRRENLPANALVGLPVCTGVVEGRARVILDVAGAHLEPDDILVTAFTDPSWTPLFVAIKGLITEVGGLMTHGAVVAREYGLPAVVGVVNATTIIQDGQRIRVNGTHGYVEILD